MTEVNPWNIFLAYPLRRREILTTKCCSFLRGCTWKNAVYNARSSRSLGLYGVSAPSRAGNKILKILSLSFFCLCHSVQRICSRVTDTSNLNSSPAGEMPRALTCFTHISVFSEVTCCSDPQYHMCPFIIRQY